MLDRVESGNMKPAGIQAYDWPHLDQWGEDASLEVVAPRLAELFRRSIREPANLAASLPPGAHAHMLQTYISAGECSTYMHFDKGGMARNFLAKSFGGRGVAAVWMFVKRRFTAQVLDYIASKGGRIEQN